jgi:3-oxoacyl-[acyl-carrier protein] reductase
MKRLSGKIAIVTGASKGIGAAVAKELALHGASVVVNYASDKAGADKVVQEIAALGGKAAAVRADVSKIDILVNNAGVFRPNAIEKITEEEFYWHFNTNVMGLLLMVRESLNYFKAEGGSIINITSAIADNPVPGYVLYSATKGAVDTITVELSLELAARKIRVNAIAPGAVETEGTNAIQAFSGEVGKQIVAMTPLGRIGQPRDIAKVALFLASEDSEWLTGEKITASGGRK